MSLQVYSIYSFKSQRQYIKKVVNSPGVYKVKNKKSGSFSPAPHACVYMHAYALACILLESFSVHPHAYRCVYTHLCPYLNSGITLPALLQFVVSPWVVMDTPPPLSTSRFPCVLNDMVFVNGFTLFNHSLRNGHLSGLNFFINKHGHSEQTQMCGFAHGC